MGADECRALAARGAAEPQATATTGALGPSSCWDVEHASDVGPRTTTDGLTSAIWQHAAAAAAATATATATAAASGSAAAANLDSRALHGLPTASWRRLSQIRSTLWWQSVDQRGSKFQH